MANITTGGNFSGAVNYVLDPKKASELIASKGVRLKNTNSIVKSFVIQSELNTRVTKPVGHISLSFSAQDKYKLGNDFMRKVADEYLNKIGIANTQSIVVRHYDTEHPHFHIIFNRIDNNGKTISNKNDRYRSEKICKELTRKHNLYFAKGKENVKVYRLKEPDKTKYEIYNFLKEIVPTCKNWNELESVLKKEGITINYKFKGKTNVVQGISFTKNNLKFNGSKVDRQFSYSKINYNLEKNKLQEYFQLNQNPSHDYTFDKLIKEGLYQAARDEESQPKREKYPRIKSHKKKGKGYRM